MNNAIRPTRVRGGQPSRANWARNRMEGRARMARQPDYSRPPAKRRARVSGICHDSQGQQDELFLQTSAYPALWFRPERLTVLKQLHTKKAPNIAGGSESVPLVKVASPFQGLGRIEGDRAAS